MFRLALVAVIVVVAACDAGVVTPTTNEEPLPPTSDGGSQGPAVDSRTCDEISSVFAQLLVGRLTGAVAGEPTAEGVRAVMDEVVRETDSAVRAAGLVGTCDFTAFVRAAYESVPDTTIASLSATGLELGDALAPRISIIELDDSSTRRPPQPVPDVEGDFGNGPWGPLAVIHAPLGESDLAGLSGLLRIGEDCVTVGSADRQTTVVFRNSQIRWDPVGRVITFWEPLAGIAVELRDGDFVGFGGGGTDLAGNMPWLARADEICPRGAFGVGMLGAVNGQRLRDIEP